MRELENVFSLRLPVYPFTEMSLRERTRHLAISGGTPSILKDFLLSLIEQDLKQMNYSRRFAHQLFAEEYAKKLGGMTIITHTWDVANLQRIASKYKAGKLTIWNPFEKKLWNTQSAEEKLQNFSFEKHVNEGGILIITLKDKPTREGKELLGECLRRLLEASRNKKFAVIHSVIIENLNKIIPLLKNQLIPLFPLDHCALICAYEPEKLSQYVKDYIDSIFLNRFTFKEPHSGTAFFNFKQVQSFQFIYQSFREEISLCSY